MKNMKITFREKFEISLHWFSGGPKGMHAFTMVDPDHPEQYSIFINVDDTGGRSLAAFLHEMTHVYYHHFDKTGSDVQGIEKRTHDVLLDALQSLVAEYEDIPYEV